MGSPMQESFASKASRLLPDVLFVPCGGALDILAGKKRRAPGFVRKTGLEWAFRMVQEPHRVCRLVRKLVVKG
jgi:N-acetylglucosaminyldiphosphoundecaprenol N-acetyl-beta-D-mannosaminyltransferase